MVADLYAWRSKASICGYLTRKAAIKAGARNSRHSKAVGKIVRILLRRDGGVQHRKEIMQAVNQCFDVARVNMTESAVRSMTEREREDKSLTEGTVKKGGVNRRPTTPPPPAPKGEPRDPFPLPPPIKREGG